jgi:two-component system copper resistance phosphate regulon response regulator CusR
MRVLVVEDDAKTAAAIQAGLERDGYEVVALGRGDEAGAILHAKNYDAVILDWMLPGRTGIDLLADLRARGARTPVLLLTARDSIHDRVAGLDCGADDYLVKPFALAELLARVRAMLRRAGEREVLEHRVADLVVDSASRQVTRSGRRILLTPREFDLLAYLAKHHGQTVSRRMLARDVWREVQRATPLDNVIDVHVAHLRRKIDDGFDPKLLHTVRGVGFVLKGLESSDA